MSEDVAEQGLNAYTCGSLSRSESESTSTCWLVTNQLTNPMTIYWMPTLYQHDSYKSWEEFQVNSQNKVRVRLQSVGGRPGKGLYLGQDCPSQEDKLLV